jgi:hypothetical protein
VDVVGEERSRKCGGGREGGVNVTPTMTGSRIGETG